MYISSLKLQAPIVQGQIRDCYKIAESSTCNKRKMGAILELRLAGEIFYGSSGSKTMPCKKQGPEYCQRGNGNGTPDTVRGTDFELLEYLKCPSHCAEGEAILKALVRRLSFNDSRLFITGLPCRRCTELISGLGISEVYFNGFKENSIRPHERHYVAQMVSHGTKVFHLDNSGKLMPLMPTNKEKEASKRVRMHDVEFWKHIMLDERFRKEKLDEILSNF
jgi:deoxycytidylate deaminase